jgi:hypothetical protein
MIILMWLCSLSVMKWRSAKVKALVGKGTKLKERYPYKIEPKKRNKGHREAVKRARLN